MCCGRGCSAIWRNPARLILSKGGYASASCRRWTRLPMPVGAAPITPRIHFLSKKYPRRRLPVAAPDAPRGVFQKQQLLTSKYSRRRLPPLRSDQRHKAPRHRRPRVSACAASVRCQPGRLPRSGRGGTEGGQDKRKMQRFHPCQATALVKQGAVKRTTPQNPDGGFHGDSRGAHL